MEQPKAFGTKSVSFPITVSQLKPVLTIRSPS